MAQFVAPGVVIVQTCDEVEGAVLLPIAGAEGEEELHREIGRPVDREPVAGPFAPPR